jgi:integrase
MTSQTISRITFSDIISLINNSNLSKAKKQDMASALRTIAKVLGVEPSELIADPGLLRRRLDLVSPEAHGLSRRRWANIRSLLARGLELARPVMPSRSYAKISPSWQALLSGLNDNAQERVKPLLRYLSAQGIDPSEVTLEILFAYRDAILNDRLRAKPEKTWDHLLWLWNKLTLTNLGWPQVVIPRETKIETFILQWSDFPPSFKAEVDRFIERQTGRDLSEEGPPKPWRPSTCQTRLYQLRMAASALVRQGMAPEEITSISVMTNFDDYRRIMQFFYERRDQKTSPQIAQLASFLKDVARHWVKVSEDELKRLKNLSSRLAVPRQGMTAKNRERLRPLNDETRVSTFLDLPFRIRRELDKEGGSAAHKAIQAQIAVAILILQLAPIRLKNLTQIDINKNLIARGDKVYLVIEPSDVKNNVLIDFELPDILVEMISWYLREYRDVLIKEPTDALFPGSKSGPKSQATLGQQISARVHRYTGMAFNPHLFRHAGGLMFLNIHPGQYETIRLLLGHKSIETTTSYYAGAEMRTAGQHFASTISQRLQVKHSPTVRPKKSLSATTALLLKQKGARS